MEEKRILRDAHKVRLAEDYTKSKNDISIDAPSKQGRCILRLLPSLFIIHFKEITLA